MKKISAMAIIEGLLLLVGIGAFAQGAYETGVIPIKPFRLNISCYKTTNLVFPYAIKSVDRGSRDILVQKAIGVENVLQVKAAKPGFEETNLTVITADGSLFSYIVDYASHPSRISLRFNGTPASSVAVFTKNATTDKIARNAEKVAFKRKTVGGIKDKKYDMIMKVKGIYIDHKVIYFQLSLQNNSPIDYDIKQLRFFIKDKKQAKRTASQEIEIKPLYVYENVDVIGSQSERTITIALPKFTIPNKKYLGVQLMEKKGGRNLRLKIRNKSIVDAKSIN